MDLKVSGRYEDDEWYKSSVESKLWPVAYHGSDLEGNQAIAEDKIIETAGQGQLHRHDIDVNPFSTRVNEMCGTGAYFNNRFDVARRYAKKGKQWGDVCFRGALETIGDTSTGRESEIRNRE